MSKSPLTDTQLANDAELGTVFHARFHSLTVRELRGELKDKGLSVSGLKWELV